MNALEENLAALKSQPVRFGRACRDLRFLGMAAEFNVLLAHHRSGALPEARYLRACQRLDARLTEVSRFLTRWEEDEDCLEDLQRARITLGLAWRQATRPILELKALDDALRECREHFERLDKAPFHSGDRGFHKRGHLLLELAGKLLTERQTVLAPPVVPPPPSPAVPRVTSAPRGEEAGKRAEVTRLLDQAAALTGGEVELGNAGWREVRRQREEAERLLEKNRLDEARWAALNLVGFLQRAGGPEGGFALPSVPSPADAGFQQELQSRLRAWIQAGRTESDQAP